RGEFTRHDAETGRDGEIGGGGAAEGHRCCCEGEEGETCWVGRAGEHAEQANDINWWVGLLVQVLLRKRAWMRIDIAGFCEGRERLSVKPMGINVPFHLLFSMRSVPALQTRLYSSDASSRSNLHPGSDPGPREILGSEGG